MLKRSAIDDIDRVARILKDHIDTQGVILPIPLDVIIEAAKRCELVFQHAPVGIAIADSDGYFVEVNRHFSDMLGYQENDVKKIRFMDITHPEDHDRTLQLVSDVESGMSDFYEVEKRYIKKDQQQIWISTKATAIKDINGRIKFWIGLMQDISERKQAEQQSAMLQKQLIQSQRMEAIGTLAGGIAHDFNNILHTISGYSQLLLIDKGMQSPEYHQLLEINKAAAKASELTRQLLTFSRRVDSNLQPVYLNKEIQEIKSILLRTLPKMISIEIDLDEHLKQIKADSIQIEQIIMNLCINAGHAMPGGGRLSISTQNVHLDQPVNGDPHMPQPGEYVLLSVSDTGIGMDENTLKNIFEPFFTTKPVGKGTGLGLSMVYGIVKNHGGHIRCKSRLNQGTTFDVYFPVVPVDEQLIEKLPEAEDNNRGDETILLVDDDLAILRLGEHILSRFGYQAISVSSGEEAIDVYQAKRQDIDLVILDLNMPGMGGHECLMALLKIDPDVRVIISSGYSPSRLVFEVVRYGAKDYISKPFQISELLSKIRKLLNHH